MIEKDISSLQNQVWDLQDKLEKVIRAVENDDFVWVVNCSYGIQFQTREEAQEWIDNQKKKDGSGFKKGSWLYTYSVDDIKPRRKLNV